MFTSTGQDTKPKRHPEYYFEDGNITFAVEDDLFRVHRHFFTRESAVFRDMLSVPTPLDTDVEGNSDDKPIILGGVRSVDFGRLMWMWYDKEYKHTSSSFETWHSILVLADKWQFETIAKVAFEGIVTLPGVDAMEKVAICEQYGFDRSIISKAYWSVCSRNQPLSYREAERIGWEACVLIATVRDRSGGFSEQNLETLISQFANYRK